MTVCGWLGYDGDGRPYCVHGRARKQGPYWRCRESADAAKRRYMATAKGRECDRRRNARPAARSTKALYELTRIRTGG